MSPTGPTPQFSTAEYASSGETCKSCKQAISGNYYRINGMLACQRCAEQVQQQTPKDTHAAYVRAITLGIGAAILGFILFAGFVIITGISLGYISLAVGFLIGKAMKMGSGGIGGRRYQIAAAALTYAAVSMAAIPIFIHYANKAKVERASSSHTQSGSAASKGQQDPPDDGQTGIVDNPPLEQSPPQAKPKINYVTAVGTLALIGLASPFLELQQSPLNGLLGLVILLVGIRIAWQLTAGPKLEISGPFQEKPGGALPSAAT
jgi:hypothetical protein